MRCTGIASMGPGAPGDRAPGGPCCWWTKRPGWPVGIGGGCKCAAWGLHRFLMVSGSVSFLFFFFPFLFGSLSHTHTYNVKNMLLHRRKTVTRCYCTDALAGANTEANSRDITKTASVAKDHDKRVSNRDRFYAKASPGNKCQRFER